eukprot:3877617-Pyramimonas_sp.AAC.1
MPATPSPSGSSYRLLADGRARNLRHRKRARGHATRARWRLSRGTAHGQCRRRARGSLTAGCSR